VWQVAAQSTPAQVRITQNIDPAGKDYPKVKLTVSVTDYAGQPVTGLDASAFSVSENQSPVANLLAEAIQPPMAIGFVIDSSGSLARREGALSLAAHAVQVINDWAFVNAAGQRKDGDLLALYAFKEGVPNELAPFKSDVNALSNSLLDVSTTGNTNTALFDILRMSINAASAQPAGRRVLVIFSDGIDTTSSFDVDATIKQAKDANLVIYTVGLRADLKLAPTQEGSKFLRLLAQETGGEYIWYRPALKDARLQLDAFLERMANQRSLYQLTYDTAQCSGDPSVRIVMSGTPVETSAIYKIPQHKPAISVERLVKDGVYLGTKETIQVGVICAQSPLTKVEFKINEQLEYTANAAPFEYVWDTNASAKRLGLGDQNQQAKVAVTVIGYAGPYTAEANQTVVIQQIPIPPEPLLPPVACKDGTPLENLFCEFRGGNIVAFVTVIGFIMALVAVILLIVLIRRGGMRTVVSQVAERVRSVTKTFQHQTRVKGMAGVAVRPLGLATLILESEPYTGKRIYMEEANAYIGRVPEKSDIVFEWDDYLSSRHAKIKCERGRFFVWDMQSANGTWVNDQRVPKSMSDGVDFSEAREVFDGSIIRLGPDLRLRFKPGIEQPAVPAAAPLEPVEPLAQPAAAAAPDSTTDLRASSEETLSAA
jgi:VWFA-related protein